MKDQYSNCTLIKRVFKSKHRSLSSQVIIDHEQSLSSKITENRGKHFTPPLSQYFEQKARTFHCRSSQIRHQTNILTVRGLGKKPCGGEDDTFTRKLTCPRETRKEKDARDWTWVVTLFFFFS